MLVQNVERRLGHGAVVISAYLVQVGFRMPRQFHHPPHVGILLVAAKELLFAVARDEHQGRGILPHVEQRGILVNGWLQVAYAVHVPVGKVAYHLPAEGNQSGNGVGVYTIFIKPLLVQPQHGDEVAAGRVSRQEDFLRAAAILGNLLECPGHGRRRIVQG